MSLYVNNSLLSLLATCETATYLRWGQEVIWKEKQGIGPMEVGQVLHEALAAWLKGENAPTVQQCFSNTWHDVIGDALPKQERLQRSNVMLCLQHWMAQQPRRDVKVVAIEKTFEVPLGIVGGEEILYYGTPDAILEWKGSLYVLDHKSTGDIDDDWAAQWYMNTGLQGYVWSLRKLGYKMVKGAFVNGIEIKRLPPWDGNLEKKCQTHKVKYKECQPVHVKGQWVGPLWWSDARLEQWKRDALTAVGTLLRLRDHDIRQGLDAITMDGQWRWPGCSGGRGRAPCQFRDFCNAGRPRESLTHMMVHSPWTRNTREVEEANASR
jgi:hypothetical protein